jgi:hypothetical protein
VQEEEHGLSHDFCRPLPYISARLPPSNFSHQMGEHLWVGPSANAARVHVIRRYRVRKKAAYEMMHSVSTSDDANQCWAPFSLVAVILRFPDGLFDTAFTCVMFRPASRRLIALPSPTAFLLQTQAVRPTRRLLTTAPTARKSRSWKSLAARWGLAIGGVYYYNTSNIFAEPAIGTVCRGH